jgi:membrane protein implicated in regulation of membrane protease activity
VRRFGELVAGIWEFVVGDDWMTAFGVVVALGLTGLLSAQSSAWFVMPVAVALLLVFSIWREARRHERAER